MADAETTAGFDRLASAISNLDEKSEARHNTVSDKIDSTAESLRNKIDEVGNDTRAVTVAFNMHSEQQIGDLKTIRSDITTASKERLGIWKMLAASAGSGGALGWLAGWISKMKGGP